MARRDSSEGDERSRGLTYSLVIAIKDTLLAPVRILTSKIAIRAYLTSILFASTAFFLLFFAIAAYVLFYWSYIPRIGFERVVHLQFDALPAGCSVADTVSTTLVGSTKCTPVHPYGEVNLVPDIVSMQRYDVNVILDLPRTPSNTEMGNFMLEAKMYAPGEKGSSTTMLSNIRNGYFMSDSAREDRLLAHSRRPAILTYYSPAVDLAQKAAQLHWYLLGWRQEAETLSVSLFESVEFAKGWRNVPASLRLEVQSTRGAQMQVYGARVVFRARFYGLRWVMYNHRILSAVFFILSFWGTEVAFTAIAWLALSWFIFGGDAELSSYKSEDNDAAAGSGGIKDEDDEEHTHLSDTERTFPTYGRQPPLRYQISVKKEDPTLYADNTSPVSQFPALTAAEADDEDEDADFVLNDGRWGHKSDSGLGTSMDSAAGRPESVRRRRSKPST